MVKYNYRHKQLFYKKIFLVVIIFRRSDKNASSHKNAGGYKNNHRRFYDYRRFYNHRRFITTCVFITTRKNNNCQDDFFICLWGSYKAILLHEQITQETALRKRLGTRAWGAGCASVSASSRGGGQRHEGRTKRYLWDQSVEVGVTSQGIRRHYSAWIIGSQKCRHILLTIVRLFQFHSLMIK